MLMATQSKAQLLTDVHALLKKRYKHKPDPNPTRLSVLKAVIYGICHEDTTREQANQAISRFNDEFFDWNEIRVSSFEEIGETLAGIPETEPRAQKIRRFLRQLFNRTYSFTLDSLVKKPLKEALKVLQTYEAFASDYVAATVIQQALGGHAIPIDKAGCRVLHRLGISEPEIPILRASVERAVPKNRGAEFADLIEDLANDTCIEGTPECPRCELRRICHFALTQKADIRPPTSSPATSTVPPVHPRTRPSRPSRPRSKRQNPPHPPRPRRRRPRNDQGTASFLKPAPGQARSQVRTAPCTG